MMQPHGRKNRSAAPQCTDEVRVQDGEEILRACIFDRPGAAKAGTIDERIMAALQKKNKTQTALIDAVKADLEEAH